MNVADKLQTVRWGSFETDKNDVGWWRGRNDEAKTVDCTVGIYLETDWFGDAGLDAVSYDTLYAQIRMRPGGKGAKIERRGGAPLKADLIGKANGAEVWQAFAEILDNLLDNYDGAIDKIREVRGDGNQADLKVEIRFASIDPMEDTNKNGEIQIEENSGGVPPERRDALVQSGNSNWDDVAESVGVWGNGSKVALLKLGRWNVIQTYPIKGEGINAPNPVQLQFGGEPNWEVFGGMDDPSPDGRMTLEHNYYHRDNSFWFVDECVAESGYCLETGPGTTCINIRRIRSRVLTEITSDELYLQMVNDLKQCFAKKINDLESKHGQNISIIIKNPSVPDDNLRELDLTQEIPGNFTGNWEVDRNLFAWIPGLKPEIHKIQLEIDGKPPLKMEVKIGFPLENEAASRGFSLWGNQRLFDKNWCDVKPSGRSGTQQWNYGANVQAGRCSGMIFFSGNPEVIPWQGPVKWGFRNTHPYAELVKDTLKWIVTKYTTASSFDLKNDNLLELFKRG